MNTHVFRAHQSREISTVHNSAFIRLLTALLVCCCIAAEPLPSQESAFADQPPASPDLNGTQYLSIPAAAFHPDNYISYDYTNYGSDMVHHGFSGGGAPVYYATLSLPHLSTITKVTFWYGKSSTTGNHSLKLARTVLTDGSIPTYIYLAELYSAAESGYGSASTSAGFSALVNNGSYSYILRYSTDTTGDTFYRVLVEYTPPGGTPSPEKLSIPPASFVSFADSLYITNVGSQVMNTSGGSTYHIQAPVLLPNGATVLNSKFYFYDADAGANIEAHLHRTDLAGSWDPALAMADIYSSGSPGWSADLEPIARYATIDNSRYAYWVYYQLPPMTSPSTTLIGRELTIDFNSGQAYPIQSVSIPAAAFTPKLDGQSYENHGRYLKSLVSEQTYVAPLYLPHGTYIRRVRFYYERIGPPTIETRAYLRGMEAPAGSLYPNVYLQSGGGTGWTNTDSGLLEGLQIDNQHNRYWLQWEVLTPYMAGNYVLPSGMVVEISEFHTLLFLPVVKN